MVEDQKAVSGDTDLSDDEMIGYLEEVMQITDEI